MNDALDNEPVPERCEAFGGGFDAFTRSTLLPPDAFQYGENILVPENLIVRTRPGADRVATNLAAKTQGLAYYDTPTVQQLIVAANTKYYRTDATLAAWTEMAGYTPADGDVRISAAQGINKLLVTDGQTYGMWDGAAWTTFANNANSPPRGATVLLFHAGRMWAAGFDGSGGAGKESDAVCVSALLTFGEGDWNLLDRSFDVGAGDGDPVLGLCKIPASVPEQAILGVLKRNSIHLVRTDPQVAPVNYQDQMAPETVSNGLGIVGRRAFAVLGNDLYFVAPDGSFRSLARMEAAAAQYAVSAPLSTALQPFVDRINWDHADLITVTRYKQLALFSVPLDNAVVPNTVFIYSARLQRWVGIFTGWTPNCFEVTRFNGKQRLMHGDNLGNVRQWKDYADQTDDATYLDDGAAYASKLWTRSFLFGSPINNKRSRNSEVRFGTSNAMPTISWVQDGNVSRTWEADLEPAGPNLPIDLDFDLTDPNNIPIRRGLRGLSSFNEAYLRIESAQGWWSVRNISLLAVLRTLASVTR